jgi:DNA-binding SARP family transcriptional activator
MTRSGVATAPSIDDAAPARPAQPVLTITAMGASLVRGPDGVALGQLGVKSVALLAFLALQPGQAASRDTLVELLWPRGDAEQGRASLRQELRRIKKGIGPMFDAAIDAPSGQVALRPGAVPIDARALELAVAARDTAGLARVLDIYGGAFLAPLAVSEVPFQDWVTTTNSRLEESTVDALLRLMLLDEAAGRLDRAGAAARKLLGIDPFQEDVHAALIRIHAAAGRIGAARQQLERCRALFIEELGEDPGPTLAKLIPEARTRRAAAAIPEAPRIPPGRAPMAMDRPRRPLAALSVRPAPGAEHELAPIAHQVASAVLAQLGPGCWIDLTLPDALGGAGALGNAVMGNAVMDRASCIADVRLSYDEGRLRADITCARRPDGAMSGSRTVIADPGAEVAPAIAMARQVSAVLSATFMAAAEAEAAAEDAAEDAAGDSAPRADGWLTLMRAHRLYRGGDGAGLDAARRMLEQAVRADPELCEATCLLSMVHLAEVTRGLTDTPRESMFRARELALRSVRRTPAAAWPHYALGAATPLEDDPLAAQSQHLHALRLSPGFAAPMGEIARGLALAGDDAEAEAWAARAAAAGPDDPAMPDWLHARAMARYAARDWAAAAQAGAEAAAARPGWAPPALLRAASLRALGDAQGADRTLAMTAAQTMTAAFADEALRCAHPFANRALTDMLSAELARLNRSAMEDALTG